MGDDEHVRRQSRRVRSRTQQVRPCPTTRRVQHQAIRTSSLPGRVLRPRRKKRRQPRANSRLPPCPTDDDVIEISDDSDSGLQQRPERSHESTTLPVTPRNSVVGIPIDHGAPSTSFTSAILRSPSDVDDRATNIRNTRQHLTSAKVSTSLPADR
ncbi:hypothetical protein FKP32DRAFT_290656 [Trametes sanguinea]|nr:hypothetical protein FKP32DRAFT_290656 [Trametes sanguinea]